ncbi:MAG: hypothetical protein U0354_08335 [Candidatus Sericytochromatia bacterium]
MDLKKLITAITITVFTFQLSSNAEIDYKPYKSKKGFSIKYPNEWSVFEKSISNNEFTFLSSPLEDKNDNFSENLNVLIIKANMSTDKYLDLNISDLKKGNTLKNGKLIKRGDFNKNKIKYIIYSHNYNNYELKVKGYYICNGKNCYNLTGTSTSKTFNTYEPIFDAIASSFEIS